MRHLDDGVLQAWLDGSRSGLDAAQRVEMGGHLAECDACQRRLEELEAMSGRIEELLSTSDPTAEPMPSFDRVLAHGRRGRAGRRGRSGWSGAVWAASVAAAIGAGWIASDLYRGERVVRPVAHKLLSDSGAAGTVARARTLPDTATTGPAVHESRSATSGTTAEPSDQTTLAAAKLVDTTSPGAVRPTSPRHAPPATASVLAAAKVEPPDSEPISMHAEPTAAPVERVLAALADRSDSASPPSVIVRGRVTDESGRPLAGAQVSIVGTSLGTLARADGSFHLRMARTPADSVPREVTLTARMIGYKQVSHSLAIRGGQAAAEFELSEEPIALQGLVVSAKGVDTGGGRTFGSRVSQVEPDTVHPLVVFADDSTWGPWRAVAAAEAETQMGFRPLTVPDLPVVRIEVGVAQGAALLRVVQTLQDDRRLELIEAARPVRFGNDGHDGERASATVQRRGVWVAAGAPLPARALADLLERLR